MPLTPLNVLLRDKYEALIGVDIDRSFETTKREYFISRSGVGSDHNTPTSFYMNTTFDNLTLEEGYLDYRERKMFIDESAATEDLEWEDAARIWAETP